MRQGAEKVGKWCRESRDHLCRMLSIYVLAVWIGTHVDRGMVFSSMRSIRQLSRAHIRYDPSSFLTYRHEEHE